MYYRVLLLLVCFCVLEDVNGSSRHRVNGLRKLFARMPSRGHHDAGVNPSTLPAHTHWKRDELELNKPLNVTNGPLPIFGPPDAVTTETADLTSANTAASNQVPAATTTKAQGPPSEPPSDTQQPDNCNECSIIYKYVSVFFPPAASSNTDCFTGDAAQPTPGLPPGLQPQPGSAYVVIPELSAGNACTLIAQYTSLTFTFGPGELSTIQGPANITKEFNFADLPCPPPDVASEIIYHYNPAVNPTQTYSPFIAPFSQLYDLDPAFRSCTVGPNQGFDPATALPAAEGPTFPKPKGHLGLHLHRRKPPTSAHNVPQVPLETGSPSSRTTTKGGGVLRKG